MACGTLKANAPVWGLLSQEMNKPGRQVRREHVSAHVNVYGSELANWLAVEGMCSNPLWSKSVRQDLNSGSTVGLRGGSDSDAAEMIWEELGLRPMDSEELSGEAPGMPLIEGSCSESNCSENLRGGRGEWQCDSSFSNNSQFSTDVSDTQRRRT